MYGIYIHHTYMSRKFWINIYNILTYSFYHPRVLQTLRAPYPLASPHPCLLNMSKVDTRVILSCGFLDHFSSSFSRCQRGFQVMRLNGIFLRLGDAFADVDGSREYTVTFWSRQRRRLAIESLGGHPYVWSSGWLPWNWELLRRGRFHSQVEHDGH